MRKIIMILTAAAITIVLAYLNYQRCVSGPASQTINKGEKVKHGDIYKRSCQIKGLFYDSPRNTFEIKVKKVPKKEVREQIIQQQPIVKKPRVKQVRVLTPQQKAQAIKDQIKERFEKKLKAKKERQEKGSVKKTKQAHKISQQQIQKQLQLEKQELKLKKTSKTSKDPKEKIDNNKKNTK